MGGNRWEYVRTRSLVEDVPGVDVRALIALARGGRGGPRARRACRRRSTEAQWLGSFTSTGRRGDVVSWSLCCTIRLQGSVGLLSLSYRYAGSDYAPGVRLTPEAMRFGGVRWWAVCPRCERRCTRIFVQGPSVACRLCFGLTYRSTRTSYDLRAAEMAERILTRVGEHNDQRAWVIGVQGLPWRPPRMRWATYERLQERYSALQARVARGWQEVADSLLARANRKRRARRTRAKRAGA